MDAVTAAAFYQRARGSGLPCSSRGVPGERNGNRPAVDDLDQAGIVAEHIIDEFVSDLLKNTHT